jgi:hypothetical protein
MVEYESTKGSSSNHTGRSSREPHFRGGDDEDDDDEPSGGQRVECNTH